jgi:hypothetical protein
MEHYFSLHGIIDDLQKLKVGVLYLDVSNVGSGGNGIRRLIKATLLDPICASTLCLF